MICGCWLLLCFLVFDSSCIFLYSEVTIHTLDSPQSFLITFLTTRFMFSFDYFLLFLILILIHIHDWSLIFLECSWWWCFFFLKGGDGIFKSQCSLICFIVFWGGWFDALKYSFCCFQIQYIKKKSSASVAISFLFAPP